MADPEIRPYLLASGLTAEQERDFEIFKSWIAEVALKGDTEKAKIWMSLLASNRSVERKMNLRSN